jgi:hypothetical protein
MAFERIDHLPLAVDGGTTCVISPVRDEMGLLPHFLAHHRKIGVRSFVFIDNNSKDGTTEYLLSQPDCAVWFTDEAFYQSAHGIDWINRILTESGYAGWLIYLDADEHLAYSGMETVPLAGFLDRIQAGGADTVFAVMVDMYPEGDFADLAIAPGDDLHAKLAWFDTDYVLRPWPRRPWDDPPPGFELQVLGGPRCRLLSDLRFERRRGALHYTLENQIDRFVGAVPLPAMPLLARVWPCEMPAQQKKPINFVGPGFRYTNNHSAPNHRPAGELVALLHFKFCHELQQRVRYAVAEGNHYRRGLAHHQLAAALARWGRKPLTYAGSRRFRSSKDLEDVGLVGAGPAALWKSGAAEVVTGMAA